jgi:hypothetical protein
MTDPLQADVLDRERLRNADDSQRDLEQRKQQREARLAIRRDIAKHMMAAWRTMGGIMNPSELATKAVADADALITELNK